MQDNVKALFRDFHRDVSHGGEQIFCGERTVLTVATPFQGTHLEMSGMRGPSKTNGTNETRPAAGTASESSSVWRENWKRLTNSQNQHTFN